MDTNNDFLFAMQLQNELIGDGDSACLIDLTDATKRNYDPGSDVVDLTESGAKNKKKHKRSTVDKTPQPIKRPNNGIVTESVVDHSWEMLDPNPDIHSLFLAFNRQYFWSALDSVLVQWSKRMTVCAGLCRFQNGSCSISLSEPLLKLRPRKDLVETLLHEMIHAYLFLTNNKDHRDRDGHGPEFCKHMYRINKDAGTKISIYHSFHEEVRLYKQHWWRCNGSCQHNKPFYGYVKRSMNRAPGPNDNWWANHQAICGGMFVKIKEPEGYGLKKKSAVVSIPKNPVKPANKITNFIKILDSSTKKVPAEISKEKDQQKVDVDSCVENVFEMTSCPICNDFICVDWLNSHLQNCSQLKEMFGNEPEEKCKCPVCNIIVDRSLMNEHLDSCKFLSNVFEENENFEAISDDDNYVNCSNCDKVFKNINIKDHLDNCNILSNGFKETDDFDVTPDDNYVNCPNCFKIVKDININEHLDICISIESIESKEIHFIQNGIPCPCCEKMFRNIIELDDHIDNCLI